MCFANVCDLIEQIKIGIKRQQRSCNKNNCGQNVLKSYLSDWFKWNQHANSGQVWREQKAYEKFVARSMFNQMNRNVAVAAIFFMFAQVNRNKFYSFSKSLVRIRLQQYGKLHGIHSKDACCELHRFHFRWTLRGHIECARFKAIYSSFFLSLFLLLIVLYNPMLP